MNSLTFSKKSDADATFHQEIVLKKTHTNKQTKSKTNGMHVNSTNFFRTQRFQFWREITCGHSTETLPHERIWCSTGKQAGRIRISQTLSRGSLRTNSTATPGRCQYSCMVKYKHAGDARVFSWHPCIDILIYL